MTREVAANLVSNDVAPLRMMGEETLQRRYLRWTCAVVFAVSFVVFALSPVITNYDSYSTFPTAVSLVNHQTLSLEPYSNITTLSHNYTVSTSRGRLVTGYPWTDALFFIPTVVAIDALHLVGGPSAFSLIASNDMGLAQMETASLVTALACAVLAWLAFERFRGSFKRRRNLAIVCGLVFAFGTSAWSIASRSMWQHGPSLLLLGLGLLCLNGLVDGRRARTHASRLAVLCGVFFAAAVTVRPTNIVALAVVGVVILISLRRFFPTFMIGAIAVVVPWFILTYLAYGSPLQPYFGSDNRTLQPAFFEALAANLVSPARGLLIFSPVVLAAIVGLIVAKRHRHLDPLERVSVLAIPLYWALVSGFGSEWWGGNTYGPRFMSETLPFLFILSLPFVDWIWEPSDLRQSRTKHSRQRTFAVAAVILVVLSVGFNAEGGVLRSTTCWNGKPTNVDVDPSRVWSWSNPQFLTGFRSLSSGSIHGSVLSTCSSTS